MNVRTVREHPWAFITHIHGYPCIFMDIDNVHRACPPMSANLHALSSFVLMPVGLLWPSCLSEGSSACGPHRQNEMHHVLLYRGLRVSLNVAWGIQFGRTSHTSKTQTMRQRFGSFSFCLWSQSCLLTISNGAFRMLIEPPGVILHRRGPRCIAIPRHKDTWDA